MKQMTIILSLCWLLAACNTQTTKPNNGKTDLISTNNANCPPATTDTTIKLDSSNPELAFNYQIQNIIPHEDAIIFQSLNHDFVFCRDDQSWTIQPGSLDQKSLESDEEITNNLTNPPYKTIEFNGEKYQYRVILEPNPFPDFSQQAEKVIFELILPNNSQPKQQIIYTLEEVVTAKTGFQLGFPTVTKGLIYDNRIFWAISSEQGEGSGGIATIISYNPENQQFTTIKPPEIKNQQINDLAIAGDPKQPIFWIATQQSGEGNPYLPGMGLVAYQAKSDHYQTGTIKSYNVRNSPLVGTIVNQLFLDQKVLWIGTGNGICEIIWQAVDQPKNWQCWRYILEAKLPDQEVPFYPSVAANNSTGILSSNQTYKVEVLWWSKQDNNSPKGRYEIVYNQGFTLELNEETHSWSDFDETFGNAASWESPLYWVGREWYWRGDRFIRGFDAVSLNYVGGGPLGIVSPSQDYEKPPNYHAVRGNLELINLTQDTVKLKHFSAWIDDSLLSPYLLIKLDQYPQNSQPDPLQNFLRSVTNNPTNGENIPSQLLDNLKKNLAQQNSIDPSSLKVVEASQKTWPDGCLGLANADELCTQQLVEGWRIVLSDSNNKTWVYRSDQAGRIFRLEK
jgi:hypothetical protein